jgi:hypothetical protein
VKGESVLQAYVNGADISDKTTTRRVMARLNRRRNMAQYGFNAANVPDGPDMGQIPAGEYPVQIVDSGLDRNEKGTEQLRLVFKICGGQFDGRQISQWYTVKCANQTAVDIGLRQLKGVCEAVGVAGFRDTCELHGRSLLGKIGEKKSADGKVYADLKSTKPLGGGAAPAAGRESGQAVGPSGGQAVAVGMSPAPATAAGPVGRAKKPWET